MDRDAILRRLVAIPDELKAARAELEQAERDVELVGHERRKAQQYDDISRRDVRIAQQRLQTLRDELQALSTAAEMGTEPGS
jgi:uncharacterized protein (DUF3084 family)